MVRPGGSRVKDHYPETSKGGARFRAAPYFFRDYRPGF